MDNKLEKIGQNSFMDNFVKNDDILNDMCGIIGSSQKAAELRKKNLADRSVLSMGFR